MSGLAEKDEMYVYKYLHCMSMREGEEYFRLLKASFAEFENRTVLVRTEREAFLIALRRERT